MPPTILVVDDEPVMRDLVSGLLADEGYTVRSEPDGLVRSRPSSEIRRIWS